MDEENAWHEYKVKVRKLKVKPLSPSYSVPVKHSKAKKSSQNELKDLTIDYKGLYFKENNSDEHLLPKKYLKKIRTLDTEVSLDLHGYTLNEAYSKIYEVLTTARDNNVSTVLIITGKGNFHNFEYQGKIRTNIISWLNYFKTINLVSNYTTASKLEGGNGAYKIILKKRR